MHKSLFCQRFFENALPKGTLHEKRKANLIRFTSDLLSYDTHLSVTEIGKKLTSRTSVKHKIKAADYFVGNKGLAESIPSIFKQIAYFL
jgi:hypothetical protein